MECPNCHITYDVIPIELGRSIFCSNCGNLLYKNFDNKLVFEATNVSHLKITEKDEENLKNLKELEKIKQEQVILKQQIESLRQENEKQKQEFELQLKEQKEKNVENKNYINEEIVEEPTKRNFWKYIIPFILLIVLGILAYYFKDKISTLINSEKVEDSTEIIRSNQTEFINNESLKSKLNGLSVIGWGKLSINDISSINFINKTNTDSTFCTTNIQLNKGNLLSNVQLELLFIDTILVSYKTKKITFQNIAPKNSWFKFTPLNNCDIQVNTNNNPIRIKFCNSCDKMDINTNKDNLFEIKNNPTSIYITSANTYDATVDFIYIPKN